MEEGHGKIVQYSEQIVQWKLHKRDANVTWTESEDLIMENY